MLVNSKLYEYCVLRYLNKADEEGVRIDIISRDINIGRKNVIKVIGRLMDQGLVDRRRGKTERNWVTWFYYSLMKNKEEVMLL